MKMFIISAPDIHVNWIIKWVHILYESYVRHTDGRKGKVKKTATCMQHT